MKNNGSRAGQYVLVDTRYTREESAKVGGTAMRYFGSDFLWHRTLAETPTWPNRDKAATEAMCVGPYHRIARIVAKKKGQPKKLNRLAVATDWDLMVELGSRLAIHPDDIEAAIEFIRTVKS